MVSIIDDITRTLREDLISIVEKMTSAQCLDVIVRSVMHSLPEYKALVEENIRLKTLQEEVRIIITEKCDVKTTLPSEGVSYTNIQERLNEWSDKFEEFIDNIDQDDPIIESINQLKEDFDEEFSVNFKYKNIVTSIINVSDNSGTEDEVEVERQSLPDTN